LVIIYTGLLVGTIFDVHLQEQAVEIYEKEEGGSCT